MSCHCGWHRLRFDQPVCTPALPFASMVLAEPCAFTEPHNVCGSQYHLQIPQFANLMPFLNLVLLAKPGTVCSFQGPVMFSQSCVLVLNLSLFVKPQMVCRTQALPPLHINPHKEMPFCRPGKIGEFILKNSLSLGTREESWAPDLRPQFWSQLCHYLAVGH